MKKDMNEEKLLYIDCCISQHAPSRTRLLCDAFLEAWRTNRPKAAVETMSLVNKPVEALTPAALSLRNKLIEDGQLTHPSFDLAHQFAGADFILVGAPYWDLSFPAVLKAYIEQIMATNIAFHYTEHGAEGLCRAKALVYLTSAGGCIDNTNNLGYHYLQAISSMVGIPSTYCAFADGLDIIGNDVEQIMKKAAAHAISICHSL